MRSREFIKENPLGLLSLGGRALKAADSLPSVSNRGNKLVRTYNRIKWTPEMEAELKNLYAKGNTIPAIAQYLGILENEVHNKIKKLKRAGNWNLESRGIKWTPKMEADLKKLFAKGITISKIAQHLDIPAQAVKGKIDRLKKESNWDIESRLEIRNIKWTPKMEADLKKLYAKGNTIPAIAQYLGIPAHGVRTKISKLKKLGNWNLESRGIKWTPKMEADLKKLYAEGITISKIAQHLDIPKNEVHNKIAKLKRAGKWGLASRNIEWTPKMEADLKKLYAEGITISKIAQHLDIPANGVRTKISKLKKSGKWDIESRGIKWTPEMEAELKQLWNQDYSAEDIVQRLGITDASQVYSKAKKLGLPRRGIAALSFRAQGYQPFSGKTFSEILWLGGFKLTNKNKTRNSLNLSSRNSQQFLEWLDTEFLPTPEGKQLFDRMVALDTKMLRANHIRLSNSLGRNDFIINNRVNNLTNRRSNYKWNEVDEKSTITERELLALQSEFKQITDELRKLIRRNFNLQSRLQSGRGFGFLPRGRWPATTKLDTYENWRKTQRLYYPKFLDQLDQFEDTVNQLAIAQGVVTDANYARFSILSKIQKLGDPPDLVGKLRELETTFVDIRIKAGADFTKLKLPDWQLVEYKAVKSFENLPVFKSGGWNIAHVGTKASKIDIHFLLNNVVVGGAEVKKIWKASYGQQVLSIGRDKTTGVVKISNPRMPTALTDFGQKLLADKLDSKMLGDIEKQLKDIKTANRVRIDLTGTIDVSKYVRDYYSKKDQGRATFLVVGDEIFKLADEIPEALRNFPGMNRMRGIEGMQGKILLVSSINSRGRIYHNIVIRGEYKQNINSVKLNDLQ